MTISLYAATIPSYQQILGSVAGLVTRAEAFCKENGIAPVDLIQARLAPDMLPFTYQVKSAVVHSVGAIEGVRKGVFSPDMTPPPDSFAALATRVSEGLAALAKITPAEIESFIARDVQFAMGERRMNFTAEEFLLSFSQPNFYFHATTAYDILRFKGIPLGKRDYIGKLRLKA